jgi:glycerol uptake facilitator-like aquaporin
MGLSLLVSVWFFYRYVAVCLVYISANNTTSVTGGVFNPAVATALLLIGAIGPVRWVLYCLAQLIGGIVASALLLALLPGELVVTYVMTWLVFPLLTTCQQTLSRSGSQCCSGCLYRSIPYIRGKQLSRLCSAVILIVPHSLSSLF